jgi:hypothetical protein
MNMKKMMACFLASLGLNVACAQGSMPVTTENYEVDIFGRQMSREHHRC